jgi:N-carbamoylputrescine amidase
MTNSRTVTVAAVQSAFSNEPEANWCTAEAAIREAAEKGAQIVLMPELFERHYFCKTQEMRFFDYASSWDEHPARERFSELARELAVVLPFSFYECAGNAYFNSVAVIDADGTTLGIYRKTHIPQGPGYEEKFYFSPGDGGLKVWHTAYGCIGVGICWDQWFPEAARCMVLMGAEILFYPTAIGSEPQDASLDSSEHWRRTQLGHAGANMVPVVAANRVGAEAQSGVEMTFYGNSFIAGHRAQFLDQAGPDEERVLLATLDLEHNRNERAAWGLFRDRRPENYARIMDY